MKATVSLLAALGAGCSVLLGALALPATLGIIGASGRRVAKRSTSLLTEEDVIPLVRSNRSISSTGPFHDFWDIQCDQSISPPGWAAPPEFRRPGDVIDCSRAIFSVGRGGDPLMPQVWTMQAQWLYDSCGVYLVPDRRPTWVLFARVDVSEIAHAIVRKCLVGERNLVGGWAAIGGTFIVLLTGSEVVATF